jgi:mRNA interferase MazF
MPISGDVVDLDLGAPEGREAGFSHPAVVVTAQRILDATPSVVQVVPLTSTIRGFHSEVEIAPDRANGLEAVSAGQCQHVRSVSPRRIAATRGNVGAVALAQIRETMATLLDLPSS